MHVVEHMVPATYSCTLLLLIIDKPNYVDGYPHEISSKRTNLREMFAR